jgi:hypothetical protein
MPGPFELEAKVTDINDIISAYEPMHFEGIGMCFYKYIGKRKPLDGEYYVSGAVLSAHKAPTILSTEFHIVEPTNHALWTYSYTKGPPVELEKKGATP